MSSPYFSAIVIVGLVLLACITAFPGRREAPVRRWRVVVPPLLVAAAALLLLRLPPYNELRNPEVWMMGFPFALLGIGRGAWIGLQVDHGKGKVQLTRAPDEFLVAVGATLLILAAVVVPPVGRITSAYDQTLELALVILASFMAGRNAALLVRSWDAPQHDL